jgi:hypothetical protein
MVDTPFFENAPEIEALHAEDVAEGESRSELAWQAKVEGGVSR